MTFVMCTKYGKECLKCKDFKWCDSPNKIHTVVNVPKLPKTYLDCYLNTIGL